MNAANKTQGRLTVLSGPSGVGKGTVIETVRRKYSDIWVSVSVTTRSARRGEIPGRTYHFIDGLDFDDLIARGELLEWADYTGRRYGTPRLPVEEMLASGRPALLEIDLDGARQIRHEIRESQLVFLAPPSWEELVRRLTGRGSDSVEQVAARLAKAREEMDAAREFDVVLVNDDVDRVADELAKLIL
ncbi:MAG: guanylate kinase [Geodermatophilaceae bacterium]|nr:guanylate kinase [Geodermatophilaceae bacterium]